MLNKRKMKRILSIAVLVLSSGFVFAQTPIKKKNYNNASKNTASFSCSKY